MTSCEVCGTRVEYIKLVEVWPERRHSDMAACLLCARAAPITLIEHGREAHLTNADLALILLRAGNAILDELGRRNLENTTYRCEESD